MAIIKRHADGEPLTRKLAANVIAGLRGDDHLLGDDASALLDRGVRHENVDGGFGNVATGGADNDCSSDGKVARSEIGAAPLFNVFRPF